MTSNENTLMEEPSSTSATDKNSMKEFVRNELLCKAKTKSDEDLKCILDQINEISSAMSGRKDSGEPDPEDIESIIKKAQKLMDATSEKQKVNHIPPKIDVRDEKNKPVAASQISNLPTQRNKEPLEKAKLHVNKPNKKARPVSAGVIDNRFRENNKHTKLNTTLQKKVISERQQELTEELKNAEARVKSLEMQYATVTDDFSDLRSKYKLICDDNNNYNMRLEENQSLFSRLKNEYEHVKLENIRLRDSENKFRMELSKERDERKNSEMQHDKDKHIIMDLQRQCKEMEHILKRKHPDSVSALIVASKPSTHEDNTRSLLENRITQLENELKEQERRFESILVDLQNKFSLMKQKYESHITDMEQQHMQDKQLNIELKNKSNAINKLDAVTQTTILIRRIDVGVQTFQKLSDRPSSSNSILSTKLKEDTHLLATIKGLQQEIFVKDRNLTKVNRESEDLRRNVRKLHKEREVLLTLNQSCKVFNMRSNAKSSDDFVSRVNIELETELEELKSQNTLIFKEKDEIYQTLSNLEEEFVILKRKRIQDLHTLQLAHEKELMQMNLQIYPLQEEIRMLNETINTMRNHSINGSCNHVQFDSDSTRSYLKEKNSATVKNENLCQINNNNILKEKEALLEKKYQERDVKLKNVITSLVKLQSACHKLNSDCAKCSERNRLLRSHRVQLDHMLSSLRSVVSPTARRNVT